MIKVKVTTQSPLVPLIKMTPGSKGIIGKYQFFIDDDLKEADWWVVVENLPHDDKILCPKENTILITQETEVVKKYQQRYVDQFNWIITSQQTLEHPRKIYTHQGHRSYLFLSRPKPGQSIESYQSQFKSFDVLKEMTPADIPKSKILVAVVSHKQRSGGAKARYDFIMKLKEHFGDQFDIYSNMPNVFGPDTKVTQFKWDAVAPYKYVLSIENSYTPHWWTNHLFDAFIAGAYPFYYGHPTVFEYLPKNSMTMIDINDVEGSIAIIEKAISENYFDKYQKDVWEARRLVLDKYNLLQVIADAIDKLPASTEKKNIVLKHESDEMIKLKNRLVKNVKTIPILRTAAKHVYRLYRNLRYGEKFGISAK